MTRPPPSLCRVALSALLALCAALAWPRGCSAELATNHVIIVSLDGLRPDFYLPGKFSGICETLTELRDSGSYAKAALPPYPSMTYPGHATIVTGVSPARHGISANTVFEPPATDGRGFWFASDLRAPALWDLAHNAGLTVGAVSWPCTAGSKAIQWNVPEFWTTSEHGNDLVLLRRWTSPGLIELIEQRAGRATAAVRADDAAWDAWLAAAAAAIIREHKPNLMLVHLIEADKIQHKGGRNAPGLETVLRRLDGHLHDILQAAKTAGIYERTTVIVLGDHGFSDVSESIAPNVLLAREGFIRRDAGRVLDWNAMVQNTGGSAGVYLKDPDDIATAAKVRALLEKHAISGGKRLYRIINNDELLKLGGPRAAAFYLEAEPGYMFSASMNGELLRPAPIKGNHGYHPAKPEMHTGFIAAGHRIRKGVVLDRIRLVDVAPTVAQLLGLRMENTEGHPLVEILQQPPGQPTPERTR